MSLHPISAKVELICSERTYGLINEEIALSCLVLLFFISHSAVMYRASIFTINLALAL